MEEVVGCWTVLGCGIEPWAQDGACNSEIRKQASSLRGRSSRPGRLCPPSTCCGMEECVDALLAFSMPTTHARFPPLLPSSSFHPPSLLHHHHHVSHLIHNSRLHGRHGAHSCLDVRGTRSAVGCEACLHYPAWLYFSACIYHSTTPSSSTEQSPVKDSSCDGVAGALTLLFCPKLRTQTETDRVGQTDSLGVS